MKTHHSMPVQLLQDGSIADIVDEDTHGLVAFSEECSEFVKSSVNISELYGLFCRGVGIVERINIVLEIPQRLV